MKSGLTDAANEAVESPPSRGAWIEMGKNQKSFCSREVAPLAGGVD